MPGRPPPLAVRLAKSLRASLVALLWASSAATAAPEPAAQVRTIEQALSVVPTESRVRFDETARVVPLPADWAESRPRFAGTVWYRAGFRLARLILGNAAIVILSVGLLAPLAVQRSMRFWCRHLTLVGTVDLATISQSERGPSVGEGLAGFFDLDLG